MAVTWGSWLNNSTGNGMRLGYEFTQSPSSVGTGTSSVTVTLKVYVETKASVSDSSNSWSVTGNFSGSGAVSISNGSGGGTDLIGTFTRTVSTSYSGTVKSSFSASLSGINAIPGTASVSGNWYTAKRPISAPYAPDNIAASRSSDTSHTISWTKDPGTDAGHPYENIEVQRWDNVSGVYSTIVTLSGSATSYTNTSTRADRQYRWRVRAKNDAGASGWVYTGYWSTTPAAPGTPTASKSANDVTITWVNKATKGTAVEVWHATNGVWDASALTVLAGQPTSYTHVNPDPTKTHAYRLKCQAGTADDAPTTYSAYSGSSNTIQLLTNPAAPTMLAPASGTRDAAASALTLTWRHNEVDGTAQTKYDLQYRLNGGTWTMVSATTTTQAHTFAAGALPNGSTLDWQVRTYGQYATAPAYSPWSAVATLTLSATPQAGVVFPDDVTPVGTSRISAQWSYYDEEGTAQAQWKVKLYSAGGAQLLETKTGVGPATTVALSSLLKNNTGYRLGVQVQDGSGLWSPETTQDFTVSYTLPDTPTLTLSWDADRVAVVAAIQNPTGGSGAEVDHNELWRSVDWQTYELVADNIPPNSAVTDYIPALGSENVYLAVAVSPIEAAAQSEPVVYTTPDMKGWFIINGGDDFATLSRVRYSPSLSRNFSRDKALNAYAGREFPVETVGEQRKREYNLSVSIFGDDDASLSELESIADIPGPLVLRTPLFDRMYASLEGIGSTRANGYENVSMKLTQVDAPDRGTMALEPVVYRTNINPDPRALDPNNYRFVSGAPAGPAVIDGVTCMPVFENATGGSNYVDPQTNFTATGYGLKVGDVITFSADVMVTTPLSMRLQGGAYAGGAGNNAVGVVTQTPEQGWVRVAQQYTITAVSDTAYFRFLIWPTNTNIPEGQGFYFKNFLIEINGPDNEYFDGDTYEGDDDLRPRWTGTPNASPSQLTRGGTE